MVFRARLCPAFILLLTAPAAAQPPDRCRDALNRADETYHEGNFAEVIRLLTPCLTHADFDSTQVIHVHRLLSLAHLNTGEADLARQAILALLRRVPDYEPDPVQDPPAYATLVTTVREELSSRGESPEAERVRTRSWARQAGTWLGVGGGLIVVGLAAFLAADRDAN